MRYVICVFILGLCCAIARADENIEVPVVSDIEQACFTEINRVRADANLPELQFDEKAFRYARRSAEIQFKRKTLGHMAPMVGAEICASTADPEKAVRMWLKSSDHRSIMLGKSFTHMGVGNVGRYMSAQMSREKVVIERPEPLQHKTVYKYKTGPLGIAKWKVQVRVPVEAEE